MGFEFEGPIPRLGYFCSWASLSPHTIPSKLSSENFHSHRLIKAHGPANWEMGSIGKDVGEVVL
jgi:hypothetical protein